MSRPGFTFATKGGKLKRNISGPSTNPLLIIGTAVDGPINVPRQVRTGADVEAIFGPAKYSGSYLDPNDVASGKPNGASIPLAVLEAQRAGATNIWVCRATGQYATNTTAWSSTLDLRSLYPGDIYNSVSLTITAGVGAASGLSYITLNQPTSKGGSFTFSMNRTDKVRDLIQRLKSEKRNNTLVINANTFSAKWDDALSTVSNATATLTGGANETDAPGEALAGNKALFATRLTTVDTGTFDMLVGNKFPFRYCVLTGIYADDEVVASDATKSIYHDFAVFLDDASAAGLPCFGVLGLNPIGETETSALINYVNTSLLSETTGYYSSTRKIIKFGPWMHIGVFRNDYDNNQVNLGTRIAVTAGTEFIWSHPDVGLYTDSFHVWYAAKLSTLPPEVSSQRQTVDTAYGVVSTLPGKYLERLARGVGADFANDISGKGAYTVVGPVNNLPGSSLGIYDDCTAAFRDDYFRQAQLTNFVNSIHQDIQDRLIDYIGKPTGPTTIAAMKSEVQSILEGYVQTQGLRGGQGKGYDFDLYADGTDELLGIVRVNLEIFPSTALRAVVQTITVMRSAT